MSSTFKIGLINEHIVIDDAQRIVIDTGSPSSFHQSGRIIIKDEEISVPQSLPMVTSEYLTKQIGCEIKGLIGMDIINTHCTMIDLRKGFLFFNDDANFCKIQSPNPPINIDGLIVIILKINGIPAKMIVDSGAKISYVSGLYTTDLDCECTASDFSPYFGEFETKLYRCQTELIPFYDTTYMQVFGTPPALLSSLLNQYGVDGIIGVDLFKQFRLQMKNEALFFPPQGI